ncbi:MAG TPA: acyltransferase [Alcanivorax sp.]|nr:acyltransferase [Alcanivorax sp.]HCE40913.1 acyltransferase [Alcanivorax sp.]|tara:strand:+ start:2578 stop:3222 length:645 start_codon:yes stop_codon:yes gene_type:complete
MAGTGPPSDLPPLTPSDIGPRVPRRGARPVAWLGRWLLRAIGWRVVGRLPDVPRAVMIAAPHTSNHDGLVGISAILGLRLDIRFMAKHSLFRGPAGALLRAAGGIPVDRRRPGGVVAETKRLLAAGDPFWLGITPEGTREGAGEWKTGFHRIAVELGLPIIVVTFCYRRREARVLDTLWPVGDPAVDLEAIYARLDDVTPRHPERLSAPLRRRR